MTWLQGLGFNRAVKPLPRLRLLSCSKCCWKWGRAIQLLPLLHSDDLVVAEHEMLSSTSRCCSCPILQVSTLGTGPLGKVVKPQMDVPGDGFRGGRSGLIWHWLWWFRDAYRNTEVESLSQGIFVNAPQVRQPCSWGVRLGTGLSRTQVSASP